VFVLLILRFIVKRAGGADTCNHIFSLCIDKPFAIEQVLTCGRVTGKSNTCSRCISHVPEYHCLYIHGCTPVIRNTLDAAVGNGFLAIPALENSFDTSFKLFPCIIRERSPENLFYFLLEFFSQEFKIVGCKIRIRFISFIVFVLIEHFIKNLTDPFTILRFNTFSFFHNHIGIHHYKPAV